MNIRKEAAGVIAAATRLLENAAENGCIAIDYSPRSQAILDSWSSPPSQGAETLTDIRSHLGDCTRCRLAASRQNIVFGSGNPQAKLVFVGEAPGAEEDRSGEPFVGAAGKLLTRIIEAMQLSRSQVYICNVIKCRPPRNRNPQPDEVEACAAFLRRQLAAIAPDYICTLGKFAAQTLLETDAPISRLRGKFYEFEGIPLMPTFHPAFLLHNPGRKREVWEDMKKLMQKMGIQVPAKPTGASSEKAKS